MTLCHFLLVYDLKGQKLVDQRPFDDSDEAIAAYAALESKHREDRDVEIVLVGADSIDTIRQTHAHYFAEEVDRHGSRYLAGV